MANNKQMKKLKQLYRREVRGELEHVQLVKREEAQILITHLRYCESKKPKLIPKFAWAWLIRKTLYR